MAATCTPVPVDRVAKLPLNQPQEKTLPWTPEEAALVDNAWDVAQAWEDYRAEFGTARSYGAIKMRWYRAHKKLPSLEVLLAAFLNYLHQEEKKRFSPICDGQVIIEGIQEFLEAYRENPHDLIRCGEKQGWLKPWH